MECSAELYEMDAEIETLKTELLVSIQRVKMTWRLKMRDVPVRQSELPFGLVEQLTAEDD